MKKKISKIALLFILSIVSNQTFSQTATCDGILPFEEENGLLTIEMESGILPSGSDWQTGSEADPNLPGSTINYIYWDGPQSFNALSGAPITYNIKINNPGTYRLAWRGRIGTGTSGGEHNDAWLRIVADDFYATNQNNATATPQLEPRPSCVSNPDRDCPAGSSTNGYFKAFMNRHPVNLPVDQRWGFVTNTNDGSSFRFIWATFNAPGNYSVIVDARSSFFFMDKMVLRRTDVSDSTAFNLNNPESSCYDALSINDVNKSETKIYPNPTMGEIEISNLPINSNLTIFNFSGAIIKEIHTTKSLEIIDVSDLESGIYFISNSDKNNYFVKKIIKI
ncbi:T9SS type A sorting domain-containing protein [Winogradskyella flava]|uniref:T9SS type A sorting domain-containing protein n=1 Tax=Winogradskyella flava TaxID=1884876 RepID=A0A842IPG7_9FLAO|nr:T9SS type A sorting domain-containing protein [Winogradskyella flava]MBC2844681.1 T9SS type A sorting domain-containing protein [Winogradskyella flava]